MVPHPPHAEARPGGTLVSVSGSGVRSRMHSRTRASSGVASTRRSSTAAMARGRTRRARHVRSVASHAASSSVETRAYAFSARGLARSRRTSEKVSSPPSSRRASATTAAANVERIASYAFVVRRRSVVLALHEVISARLDDAAVVAHDVTLPRSTTRRVACAPRNRRIHPLLALLRASPCSPTSHVGTASFSSTNVPRFASRPHDERGVRTRRRQPHGVHERVGMEDVARRVENGEVPRPLPRPSSRTARSSPSPVTTV